MKILMIGSLANGGRERRMSQLIIGLNDHPDYEVKLLLINDKVDYQEVLKTNTKIIFLDANRKSLFNSLKDVIESFIPDIVHLWFSEIHLFLAIQRLRKRFNFKYIAGFVASGVKLRFASYNYFSHLIGYYHADAVVSNSAAGLVARRAPKRVSVVIPNGFSFARFDNSKDRDIIRREIGVDTSFAVVMAARFDNGKDWDLFMDLAYRTKKQGYDICYVAIGTGPNYETCVANAENLGLDNLIFLGRRSDVEQILLACDVGVLFDTPEHAEGISNSLMESMAAGIPVIATGTGGTPELVCHGQTGYLVKEKDSDAALSYLLQLYHDPDCRNRMGEAAKEYVKQNLSLDLMTGRYIKLYESLITNR